MVLVVAGLILFVGFRFVVNDSGAADVGAADLAAVQVTPVIVTPMAEAAVTPLVDSGLAPAFDVMCKRDPALTDVQFVESLKPYVGLRVDSWDVWVYDVYQHTEGYQVLLSIREPGGFSWARQIEAYGVDAETAVSLSKQQRVRLYGSIREVGTFLGDACNPLVVENALIVVE